jgi:hypothetical protein
MIQIKWSEWEGELATSAGVRGRRRRTIAGATEVASVGGLWAPGHGWPRRKHREKEGAKVSPSMPSTRPGVSPRGPRPWTLLALVARLPGCTKSHWSWLIRKGGRRRAHHDRQEWRQDDGKAVSRARQIRRWFCGACEHDSGLASSYEDRGVKEHGGREVGAGRGGWREVGNDRRAPLVIE